MLGVRARIRAKVVGVRVRVRVWVRAGVRLRVSTPVTLTIPFAAMGAPLYLTYISLYLPTCPLYRPYISPVSYLYLRFDRRSHS